MSWAHEYDAAMCAFRGDRDARKLRQRLGVRGWRAGGCHAFATALSEVLGGMLYGLGPSPAIADHTVLRFHDLYLDSEGTHTAAEILAEYESLSGSKMQLFPLDEYARTGELGTPALQIGIRHVLRSYLDPLEEIPKQ